MPTSHGPQGPMTGKWLHLDCVLLSGDLYHDNMPSCTILGRATEKRYPCTCVYAWERENVNSSEDR